MPNPIEFIGWLMAAVTVAGLTQALVGWWLVRRHGRAPSAGDARRRPAVTILKPLHGDEPLLEEALASFCAQEYGEFQIVFGLHDPADPAMAVIDRLRERFPEVDIEVVVNTALHGINRKISNLINIYPYAKHDVIVLADSDIHAAPDYLVQLVAALGRYGVGLVTTLYAGLGSTNTVAARLGMSQINHSFLPGALLARGLGRQDCLGATMALTRWTLERVGGLPALVHHLADDALLGRLVAAEGLTVALAATLPATTVPEFRLRSLLAHELRWGRTIQSLVPVGFALSSLQYPLFWAGLAIGASDCARWSIMLFAAAWLVRGLVAWSIDAMLGLAPAAPIWLLPVRDFLSVAIILASYGGRQVAWRGHIMQISSPSISAPTLSAARLAPGKG